MNIELISVSPSKLKPDYHHLIFYVQTCVSVSIFHFLPKVVHSVTFDCVDFMLINFERHNPTYEREQNQTAIDQIDHCFSSSPNKSFSKQ